jgi:hypothetical protein
MALFCGVLVLVIGKGVRKGGVYACISPELS